MKFIILICIIISIINNVIFIYFFFNLDVYQSLFCDGVLRVVCINLLCVCPNVCTEQVCMMHATITKFLAQCIRYLAINRICMYMSYSRTFLMTTIRITLVWSYKRDGRSWGIHIFWVAPMKIIHLRHLRNKCVYCINAWQITTQLMKHRLILSNLFLRLCCFAGGTCCLDHLQRCQYSWISIL